MGPTAQDERHTPDEAAGTSTSRCSLAPASTPLSPSTVEGQAQFERMPPRDRPARLGRRSALCLGLGAGLGAACAPRFQRPSADRPLELSKDHGLHLGFKTEWWYWNGHFTAEGRQLHFFLSFVRHDFRGDTYLGVPLLPTYPSYMGMFALTDSAAGTHQSRAKVNSPDFWAAGADRDRLFVWHDSWSAQAAGDAFYLTASAGERAVHLRLRARKPAVLYGEKGFVPVRTSPHYVYSYTHLAVDGALVEGERGLPVTGVAWFDHFIGHPLSSGIREWDWMSLQLDDGYEYMLGQLRPDFGPPLAYANFEVSPAGESRSLPEAQPVWELRRRWRSPDSGDVFRLGWRILAPELSLEVEPVIDGQEFRRLPVTRFWEGATRVKGVHLGREVRGMGFLETVAEGGLPVGGLQFGRPMG